MRFSDNQCGMNVVLGGAVLRVASISCAGCHVNTLLCSDRTWCFFHVCMTSSVPTTRTFSRVYLCTFSLVYFCG